MFGGSWNEDEGEEEGPLFGGADRIEERKRKLERAKDIASGFSNGTFEKDEEVWEIVRKIENED